MQIKVLDLLLNSSRKFGGEYDKQEKLFRKYNDLWSLKSSAYEAKRFKAMVEIARSVKPESILEAGCSEGAFTKYLSQITSHLLAVDVSTTVISRARKLNPKVKFKVCDFTVDREVMKGKYDLVVTTEVLYYPPKENSLNFLRNIDTKFLLASNSINTKLTVEKMIKDSGYKKLLSRWVAAIELPEIFKGTNISLWSKTN